MELHLQDGSDTFLRNVYNNLRDHTASQPKGPQSLFMPEISLGYAIPNITSYSAVFFVFNDGTYVP